MIFFHKNNIKEIKMSKNSMDIVRNKCKEIILMIDLKTKIIINIKDGLKMKI